MSKIAIFGEKFNLRTFQGNCCYFKVGDANPQLLSFYDRFNAILAENIFNFANFQVVRLKLS